MHVQYFEIMHKGDRSKSQIDTSTKSEDKRYNKPIELNEN